MDNKKGGICTTQIVLDTAKCGLYLGNHETTRSGLACSGELMDNKTGGIARALLISQHWWTQPLELGRQTKESHAGGNRFPQTALAVRGSYL